MKSILITGLVLLSLTACKDDSKKVPLDVLATNADTTVRPGDDFFEYANGSWLKATAIPAAESGWGIGALVQDDIYEKLKKINVDASANKSDTNKTTQQIGNFWTAAMDSTKNNQIGLDALRPVFQEIDKMYSVNDLTSLLAMLHSKGIGAGFNMYVGQDDKKSDEMAFYLSQGGLGLPNRDYYFNTDERTSKVREGYKQFVNKVFKKIDSSNATKLTEDVFQFQNALAGSSRRLADLRDPYKNYNKMSWSQLQTIAPAINWKAFAAEVGADKVDSVIVGQPEFYKNLSATIKMTPVDVLKQYLKLYAIQSYSAYMDDETYNNFFTYRKLLTGASEPKARWKRALDAEENAMGEVLGQLFVKEYFSPEAKKRYSDIVENIKLAFKERVEKLDWMTDETKEKTYAKLSSLGKKVGYPDKWKDYSALKINDSSWAQNMISASVWSFNDNMSKLGKPVDRDEWAMTPQTYNAYYNPSNNEMVLPAGIFSVPGYTDAQLDDALVYGYAAASTIGHELTHGFDDQGRQYDAQGNLQNWWNKKDEEQFNSRATGIIKQFDAYTPVDTFHINGNATQGENIADLGGMLLGLDAFKKTEAFKKNEIIGGFNALQRYFLGYALGWQYKIRDEALANRILTDVHAPAKERVNGPVVNVPEWYTAFNVKPGDKMYVPDSLRVKIW